MARGRPLRGSLRKPSPPTSGSDPGFRTGIAGAPSTPFRPPLVDRPLARLVHERLLAPEIGGSVPVQVTVVLGLPVTVERIELAEDDSIVAVCRRGKTRPAIPILRLPLPKPPPKGAEWIEAYRGWRRSG